MKAAPRGQAGLGQLCVSIRPPPSCRATVGSVRSQPATRGTTGGVTWGPFAQHWVWACSRGFAGNREPEFSLASGARFRGALRPSLSMWQCRSPFELQLYPDRVPLQGLGAVSLAAGCPAVGLPRVSPAEFLEPSRRCDEGPLHQGTPGLLSVLDGNGQLHAGG